MHLTVMFLVKNKQIFCFQVHKSLSKLNYSQNEERSPLCLIKVIFIVCKIVLS